MDFFKYFQFKKQSSSRIYLDFASSTPRDKKMIRHIPRIPEHISGANPSALHREGVALQQYLIAARQRVAHTLRAHSDEIVFTSTATESDNYALRGVVQGLMQKEGLLPEDIAVIVSDLEHSAVTHCVQSLQQQGVLLCTLSSEKGYVDEDRIVVPEHPVLKGAPVKALLISIMYGNNEIGTIQPIAAVMKRVRYLRKHYPSTRIYVHTDATQMPLCVSLDVQKLGIDLMTLGATKLYCAKGVGVLYVRRGIPLAPIVYGGGQEFGIRPGTEAVALCHEFSYALEYAQAHCSSFVRHTAALQDYFETLLIKTVPEIRITKQENKERLSHISHVVIPFVESELAVIELDARGIAVSAKSACKNEDEQESSIVTTLYRDLPYPYGAIRLSFGRTTTKQQLQRAVRAIAAVVAKYRP